MGLVVRGLSNAEVRKELYLSEPAVKTDVGRILMKLGVRDRIQLVADPALGQVIARRVLEQFRDESQ